jgi:hypothetical protein
MLCFCHDGITVAITTSNLTRFFYTAQLFTMGSSKPEAWQNITRKVNANMIQGHVTESELRELTEDLHDNWDTTYSVNSFHQLKNLREKRLMSLRTDIYCEQILDLYKEFWI